MWVVVVGNVLATPVYFSITAFVAQFFRQGDFFSWPAVALALILAGAVIAAWRRDRALGATVQTALLLVPYVAALPPPPLRAWRAFEPAVLLDWRAIFFVLFIVLAPGSLLAFTMVSVKRWIADESATES